MEKIYDVHVSLDRNYLIKAENEEMAKNIACDCFFDGLPNFEIKEAEDNV